MPEPIAVAPEPSARRSSTRGPASRFPRLSTDPPYPKPAEVTAFAPGVEYGPALSRAPEDHLHGQRPVQGHDAQGDSDRRHRPRPDAGCDGCSGREENRDGSYFLALGRALRDFDYAKIGGFDDARAAEEAEDMLQRARERVRAASAAAKKKDGAVPKVNVAVGSRKKKKKGGLAAPLAERAPAEEPAEVSAR